MLKVDARGMSCPQPVLMVKKAVACDVKALEVLVDNNTAKQNVIRFLKSNGFSTVTIVDGDDTIALKAEA